MAERMATTPPVVEVFEDESTNGSGDALGQVRASSRNASSASRAAFGAISEVRRELREAVKRDQEDHERVYLSVEKVEARMGKLETKVEAQMSKLETKVDKLETKVDKIGEHVGDLRAESGATSAHIQRLIAVVETAEEARARVALVKEEAAIKEASEDRALKRQALLKIFAVVGPILSGLGTLFLSRC